MADRSTPVLLAQLAPAPADVAANVASLVALLDAHPRAALAVCPELFLTGYDLAARDGLAVGEDDPRLAPLRAAARRHGTAVVAGAVLRSRDGRPPADVALCVDEHGRVVGAYRKVHLFGAERAAFTAGDRYEVLPLAGLRVGPLVCYDIEFPEPARALAVAGVDLLVTIAANMAPYAVEHDLFARARAVENRVPHVYVNRVGSESGFTFLGRSTVVAAEGTVVAVLPEGAPAVAVVEVPIGAYAGPDYLADRSPPRPVHVHAPAPDPVAHRPSPVA